MRRLKVCLINPRFEISFFGMQHALPILPGERKAMMPPGSLPLLAALVPPEHEVTIIDENAEEIDFERLRSYDVIGLTGMIVQRQRMDEILRTLRETTDALLCVGGPYVTVDETHFDGLCDVVFLGEADETWGVFIADYAAGRPTERRYKQAEPTNMETVPCPRYDLLDPKHYVSVAMQFSRGCPFLCEFCDIIVIFGRKPRLKKAAQITAELDRLKALGTRAVFFVDDNFIGNKKLAAAMLRELVDWQVANGYPMTFSTEASINLGDEPEILDLLWKANFRSVFIGIESPRPESLLETKKVQNVRGDSIDAKLDRVRDAGIVVQAGFIVGFDNDDARVFDEQFNFIQRNAIGISVVSILSPIPSTPLYERLEKEGRLIDDDDMVWFQPKAMSLDELKQGYMDLNRRLFDPYAFFERIYGNLSRSPSFRQRYVERAGGRRTPTLGQRLAYGKMVGNVTWRLGKALAAKGWLGKLSVAYARIYWTYNAPHRPDRLPLLDFVSMCARHWHHFVLSNETVSYWGRAGFKRDEMAEAAPRQLAAGAEA
ncbi:B12-binding domain-containing radical SAM protein [Ancylobacter sp. MQZ15Z-1]|uniref:B12-binding domain-containing radical SAM protein n=1 Tax=Ancylobacter mangrovi TaxID=2972472 RepID=A0A9X2T1Y3_9HYPH|nr:B12-binding domain-containing radical SAM protein [Ancylobacter mangrovi]MCS0495262.1 B12-binding domain-containing radical SAM protein [Ancylobacter mangrovi]